MAFMNIERILLTNICMYFLERADLIYFKDFCNKIFTSTNTIHSNNQMIFAIANLSIL